MKEKKTVKPREKTDPIITDPQGSYTGQPMEYWDLPIQDADDL